MDEWGFSYQSQAIWHKTGPLGMGKTLRIRHEILLVGFRGGGLPITDNAVSSVIRADRTDCHSKKPVLAYEAIERLWPGARRLELFARPKRKGWTQWGSEAEAALRSGAA
ncbi:MAG: MT-A70 family methyltransferase [Candidatus Eremiobacteraeota bacterium]|nr:MT-A70 family methyltransferase [Candidatus Eremiobacteraeota bacterium]